VSWINIGDEVAHYLSRRLEHGEVFFLEASGAYLRRLFHRAKFAWFDVKHRVSMPLFLKRWRRVKDAIVWLAVVSDCVQRRRLAVKCVYWLPVLRVVALGVISALCCRASPNCNITSASSNPIFPRAQIVGVFASRHVPGVVYTGTRGRGGRGRCYRYTHTKEKRMQIATVHWALWLKYDTGKKCDCRLWVCCCIDSLCAV